MSQPAHKLSEEGAVRETRRPFSSFIRRLFSGPGAEEERDVKSATKELPQSDEQPEEFWNPKQGAPPIETVRPMRPQFPVWKKDIPGLTDPFLEEDEWQDPWLRGRKRERLQTVPSRESSYDDGVLQSRETAQALQPHDSGRSGLHEQGSGAQNRGFSTLSLVDGRTQQSRPLPSASNRIMDQHSDHSENLDSVVDRLLRDKDFLLAEELKHKAEEVNQLLVQAQRQKMKVELTVSELESRPGNKISWLDIKIFKEI